MTEEETIDWDEVLVTRDPDQKEVSVSFVNVEKDGSPGGGSGGGTCPPGTFKHYSDSLLENGGFEVVTQPNNRITLPEYPDFIDDDFFVYVSREEARPFDEWVEVSFQPRPDSPFPWTVDKLPDPVRIRIEGGQVDGKAKVKMPEGSKWSQNPELYPSDAVGLYYLFDMVIESPACDSRPLILNSPCTTETYVLPTVETQGRRPFLLLIDICGDEFPEGGGAPGEPIPGDNPECAGHDCLAYENEYNAGAFGASNLAITYAVTDTNAAINFGISTLEMSQLEPQSIGRDGRWYAYGKRPDGGPSKGLWAGDGDFTASPTSFPIRSGAPISDPDEVLTCTPRYLMMKNGLPASDFDTCAMVNRGRNIDWGEDAVHYGWTLQDNDLGPADSGYRTALFDEKYFHEKAHEASAICMVVNRLNPEAPITQLVKTFIAATGIASFNPMSYDVGTDTWTVDGRRQISFEVWGEIDFGSNVIVLYNNITGEFGRLENKIQPGVPFIFKCSVEELSVTHYRDPDTDQIGYRGGFRGSVSVAGAGVAFQIDKDFGIINGSGATWFPSKLYHPKGGGSGDGSPVRLMLNRSTGGVSESNVGFYTLAFGPGSASIDKELTTIQRVFKKYLPPPYCERIPE